MKEKKDESLIPDLNTIFKLQKGTFFLKVFISSFFAFHDTDPRNGRTIIMSSFGTVWTTSFFSKSLLRKADTHLSTNFDGYPFFENMFLSFSISSWRERYDELII